MGTNKDYYIYTGEWYYLSSSDRIEYSHAYMLYIYSNGSVRPDWVDKNPCGVQVS